MKKMIGSLVGVLALLMVMGFGSRVFAAGPIKLGVCEPLSGTFKNIGEHYLEGVQYAVSKINAQGGLLGRQVQVIPVDTELKPDVAIQKATKLILNDGVKYFCGGTGSSVGGALSKLAANNGAIMLSYGMDAASLTGSECNKHFFRTSCNTDTHSYALAEWVAKAKYKRVFCIAQDYSFGKEATAAFIKKLKELNPSAQIVGQVYHKLGTKDFAPYVSQIIAAKPDIVFTPNWGSDLTLLLKQANSFGLKAKFACYYLNDEDAIKSIGNDAAVIGSIASEVYMLSIPTKANKEFIAAFKKEKGYYPTWLRGKAYMGTMFWAEALKKAGSDDVNKVIKAWEGLTYNGPAGKWYMRPCDHQAQVPIWMAKIVKNNPYFKNAYVGKATMIPAKDVEVPCDKTGCPGLAK